jgi:Chaperone of endosialidase
MHPSTRLSTTTPAIPNLISQSPLRRCFPALLIAFALVLFALSPRGLAVTPEPDGAYPNQNTAEGESALFHLTTGANNTGVGFQTLFTNEGGSDNTAVGSQALHGIGLHRRGLTGNTAVGARTLQTAGFGGFGNLFNTAVGDEALSTNYGNYNTATGAFALQGNSGFNNTASGYGALQRNSGGSNTATGALALSGAFLSGNFGDDNTATGATALRVNISGHSNTANGSSALGNNTTGFNNTGVGFNALASNSTGNNNSAIGDNALLQNTGSGNVAAGAFCLQKNTTGSGNIAIGINSGSNLTTGSDNIDIAAFGVAGESGTIRIGNEKQTATYIAGIYGTTVASGVGVVVASNGQLGTITSSARFKEAIQPMDKASEAILALNPVTFRYRHELDPDGIPQFGLVAEQVEKVNPDLVVRDKDGKAYTVRYEAVNAMLLNEFLKEHRTVEDLKATAAKEQATIERQQKQIDALTTGLQKVSAAVELNKQAPTQVADNR